MVSKLGGCSFVMCALNSVGGFWSHSFNAFSRSSLSKISCIASKMKFSIRDSPSLFSRDRGVLVYKWMVIKVKYYNLGAFLKSDKEEFTDFHGYCVGLDAL